MQNLGHTRSAHRADHLLHTPDTFVRAPLPGMQKATAIVHTGPAAGARFTQYTVEFEAGGTVAPASVQRFVYMLDGQVSVGDRVLGANDYAYLPPGNALSAFMVSRAAVIEKPYQALTGVAAPGLLTGSENSIEP